MAEVRSIKVRKLPTNPIGNIDRLALPEVDEAATLESSAMEIFTDFSHHRPNVIESSLSRSRAIEFMQRAHIKVALVVDPSNRFLGVLSASDLRGERMQQLRGKGVSDDSIFIRDLMSHREELRAIDFDDVASASIGDIVETLRQEHREHILVIDAGPKIRGLFSAQDIARRLHIPLDITKAPTFADICHVVFSHTH